MATKSSFQDFFNRNNFAIVLIAIITLYLVWLLAKIFSPYYFAFFLALFFYIGTKKIYNRLSQYLLYKFSDSASRNLSAGLSLLLLCTFIVVPCVYVIRQLSFGVTKAIKAIRIYLKAHSSENLYEYIPFLKNNEFIDNKVLEMWEQRILQSISKYFDFSQDVNPIEYLLNTLGFVQSGVELTIGMISTLFFTLLITYFLLVEEKKIFAGLLKNLPFTRKNLTNFLDASYQLILSLLKGTMIVALLLGGAMGICFIIADIPNVLFFAALSGLATLLPIVGSSIVWVPVALYTILTLGTYGWASFILIYGSICFVVIEIVLRPRLLQTNLNIHPIIIFFSLLGGIVHFGIVGILLGPMIVSLFVILWRFNPMWK